MDDESRRYNDDLWRQIRDGTGVLLHEIRCAGCREPVLQIWQLKPWRAILTRTTKPNLSPIPDMSPAELAVHRAAQPKSNQLDKRWRLEVVTDEDLSAARHTNYVSTACECRREITFTRDAVLAREGKRSSVKPPRRRRL